jgi:hypothetical protein
LNYETWIKWSLFDEKERKELFDSTNEENDDDGSLYLPLDQQGGVRTLEHPIWKKFAETPNTSAIFSQHPHEREQQHFFENILPSSKKSPFEYNTLSPTIFQSHTLLHFWTLSVRYKLSSNDLPGSRFKINLLGSDDARAGFLFHVDDEESRNHALPATGELLIISGSAFTGQMGKGLQDRKIAPEPEARLNEWLVANNAFNVMMVAQESSGIYERVALGLLSKGALTKAIGPPEWKEIILG